MNEYNAFAFSLISSLSSSTFTTTLHFSDMLDDASSENDLNRLELVQLRARCKEASLRLVTGLWLRSSSL